MIVETQVVGPTDVEVLAPNVAHELRAALGTHELQLRRVTVRLSQERSRNSCQIRALLRHGGCLIVQKRSRSLKRALSASIAALVQSITLRTAQLARAPSPRPWGGAERSLLFALPALGDPTGSLQSAAQLALRTGRTLHVLRVLPAARTLREPFEVSPLVAPTREAERRLMACRETRAWCDQALSLPLPELRITVRAGEFVSEIAQRAQELRAELISVPPMQGRSGSLVAALARSAAVPVLVTREQGTGRSFLAASDLEDESYPILRKTAELASDVAADVLLFHDLDAPAANEAEAATAPANAASSAHRVELQRQRLLGAARRWLPGGRVVVTRESDPARAIVTQAAHDDVDTIVVGTRPSPWLARRMAQTVAARVVEAADRSVLVVPIDDTEAPHSPAFSARAIG